MKCPSDQTVMRQVTVSSHYGQSIILEQCLLCGGIWFDKSELHRTKQGEAEKVEALNMDKLKTTSRFEVDAFLCPKDKSELLAYKDSFFPNDIILDRCKECDGLWLNKGEFIKYQEGRQVLKNKNKTNTKGEEVNERVMKILEAHSSSDMTEALGNLGTFLSTPINRFTMRPVGEKKSTTKEDVITSIVQTLLRMLLARN